MTPAIIKINIVIITGFDIIPESVTGFGGFRRERHSDKEGLVASRMIIKVEYDDNHLE